MGKNSSIEWCDHTFSPWWGCAKVSPACDHCYAETWAIRTGFPSLWGVDAERRTFGEKHWNEPRIWNRKAAERGIRERVFCASMADVFDNHPGIESWRARLWTLVRETPHLDWLLLTKRVSNIAKMVPPDWGAGWPSVWLGISVATQTEADRDIPRLLAVPAAVHFLSCEPLLEDLDLTHWFWGRTESECAECPGDIDCDCGFSTRKANGLASIDWVIAGGESGPRARPMDVQWIRNIAGQCKAAGVACFVKQLGAHTHDGYLTNTEIVLGGRGRPRPADQPLTEEKARKIVCEVGGDDLLAPRYLRLRDRKGGDPAEWPEDLRVREFPRHGEHA